MANSMDNIIIKYGVRLNPIYSRGGEQLRAQYEKQMAQAKSITLAEFIKLDPKTLSYTDQKVQEALKTLYELNGTDSKLYHAFPNWRQETTPLTIDCTSILTSDMAAAAFTPSKNTIQFKSSTPGASFVCTLAHELKHAEQYSQEVYAKTIDYKTQSSIEYHQLRYLSEAQAYSFEMYVGYLLAKAQDPENWKDIMMEKPFYAKQLLLPLLEQYDKNKASGKKNGDVTDENLTQKMMTTILPNLYRSHYRLMYQTGFPISDDNKGTGLQNIPDSFHLSAQEQSALTKVLRDVPTEPWVLDDQNYAIFYGSEETLKAMGPRYIALSKMPSLATAPFLKTEEEFIKIGEQSIQQYDSMGIYANSPSCRDQYFAFLIQRYPEHPFITKLLATHTKQGMPWVSIKMRREFLKDYIDQHNIDEIDQQLQKWQKKDAPLFHPNEINYFMTRSEPLDNGFLVLEYFDPLDESSSILTDPKDLKYWQEKQAKVFHLLTKYTKLEADDTKSILNTAIQYGHIDIIKSMIQHTDPNVPPIVKNDFQAAAIDGLFSFSVNFNSFKPAQKNFMKRQLQPIVTMLFDAKDDKGKPLISQENITTLRDAFDDSETGKMMLSAFKKYNREHPNDKRFVNHLQDTLAQNADTKSSSKKLKKINDKSDYLIS